MPDVEKDMRQREADLIKLICCDGKCLPIENEALPFSQFALLLINSEFDSRFMRRMPKWLSGQAAGSGESESRMEDVLYTEIAKMSLGISAVCAAYNNKFAVLLYAQPDIGDFASQCRAVTMRLASVFELVLCSGACFVLSRTFSSPRMLSAIFMEANAQFDACLFRGAKPAILPDARPAEDAPPPKPTVTAALERKLFLKLINYDFAGSLQCLGSLIELIGYPGSRDLAVFKTRLFYLMENASFVLSQKAGRDDCPGEAMGEFLNAFFMSESAGQLKAEGARFIGFLESAFSPLRDRPAKNVREVLAYLHGAYTDPAVSVAALAGRFDISVPQLSRSFKKNVGEALSDYLLGLRTERAKQLLLTTDLNIESIAELSGFSNAKTLYRAVEKTEGVTPKQFRKMAAAKADPAV